MKVSWFWLSQILDLSSTNVSNLENSLTIAGFEIDSIKTIDVLGSQDIILDIISIPNRYDLSNIVGIAREVGTVLRQQLNFNFWNTHFLNNQKKGNRIKYSEIADHSHCLTILMKNVQVKSSPKWLQDYLIHGNINPVNTVIDIKNYINIKWGQDFQIFDISNLSLLDQGSTILVKSCQQETVAIYLKHSQVTHKLVPISVNSILAKTITTNNIITSTSTILIQAVTFNKLNHKKNFDLSTIKSIKNLQDNLLFLAIQESVFLYKKFCKGFIQEYNNLKLDQDPKVHIKLTKKNLIRILSPAINQKQLENAWEARVTEILSLLNLSPLIYPTYWLTDIPKQRQYDLNREVDLIEEIARIYGFQQFDDVLPCTCTKNKISQQELLKRQIRYFLRSIGLHELVHSSLHKQQRINIFNPLSDEYNGLRSNLVTSLIDSLYYNIHQSSDNFDGFEIGKVFYNNYKSNTTYEKLHLGMMWSCKNYLRADWSSQSKALSWFQAKGMLSNLCQSIGITLFWDKFSINCYLKKIVHSQRTAVLYSGKYKVGFFGEVNPQLRYNMGIKQSFYICELDLDAIVYQLKNSYSVNSNYQLKPYSRYPCVTRDISMIVGKNVSISSIMSKINSINNSFIKSIDLFDEYLGNQIPANKRSLSLRVTYQSLNATLTNAQITQLNNSIRDLICKKLDIKIR
uniref:phenylalanine--tRNA ligase n=1 Tax=Hildenbrandia rubra TaxID=31481 RepID=A0A1C9CG82_9FLOR|nr:phenylalanyl-tRNA synthetase beta chain [Hildenbrandia rubra]AOM67393.1 phenylalanyl-tRNA synthetase beta chain [Hildenbrandia rubra]